MSAAAGPSGDASRAPTATLLRRLVRDFLRPQWRRIVLALVAMGVAAGATAGNAWLMQPVLDDVFFQREAHNLRHSEPFNLCNCSL